MIRVDWQLYWPNWWKLWPVWEYIDVDMEWVGRYTTGYFFFGPYQAEYYLPYGERIG